MPSAINASFPTAGNATTASVRANFAAAKAEIEALQSGMGAAGVGRTVLGGDNRILATPTAVPAPDRYVIVGHSNTLGNAAASGTLGNIMLGASNTLGAGFQTVTQSIPGASFTAYSILNVVAGQYNNLSGSTTYSNTSVFGTSNQLYGGAGSRTVVDSLVFGSHNQMSGSTTPEGLAVMIGANLSRNIIVGNRNVITSGSATAPHTDLTIIGNSINTNSASGSAMNTIIGGGYTFGLGVNRNVIVGSGSATSFPSAGDVVVLGHYPNYNSLTSANYVIAIGNRARFYNNGAHIGDDNITTISYGNGTGSDFTVRSDSRLKENITLADIDRCLNDINRLKVSRFSYKSFIKGRVDRMCTGFLSSDFAQVFPKSVSRDNMTVGGHVFEEDDPETGEKHYGEIVDQELIENCESIDPSQLVPTLVAAVQALSQQVRQLETGRAALSAQLHQMQTGGT